MSKKQIIFVILAVVALNITHYLIKKNTNFFKLTKNQNNVQQQIDCVTKITKKIVRGDSMSPIIKSGQTIKIAEGYYDCHEVQRGDVVEYKHSGNENPLIKRVLVLSGDEMRIVGDNLVVDGVILKNSSGQAYLLNEQNKKMISLYINNHGRLQDGAYLIFGESQGESLDSRRFGAVGKSGFLGKMSEF